MLPRSPQRFGWSVTLLLGLSVGCGDDAGGGGAGATSASATTASAATGGTTKGSGATSGSGSGATTVAASGTTGAGPSTGSGMAGMPRLGAHGLSFIRYQSSDATVIDSPPLDTQPSGSTIVVSAGRGTLDAADLPTDNQANAPYVALDGPHAYTLWPSSGTTAYAFTGAVGGPGHVVSTANAPGDEVTLAVVEVVGGTTIADAQWVERLEGEPITSASVTTTGPATLIAFWWGDAGVDGEKVAVPDSDFQVIDSVGEAGALVQCFVAAREVAAAGTYQVTWSSTPQQGAQLWLVAVQ